MKAIDPTKWSGEEPPEEGAGRLYDHRLVMRILRYLKPSAALVVVATSLLVLFSLASLAGPLITGIGIDRYIASGDHDGLTRICLVWFGLLVLVGALHYAQLVTTNLIGQRAMLRLRGDIYAHLQRLPIAHYDSTPTGRLLTRVTNDVEVLNQMFTQGVVAIIGDVFALLGIVVVLVVMDPELALVALCALPLLFLISVRFRWRVRQAYRGIRTAVAKINTYLQESIGGIAIIKSLRRETVSEEEFGELSAEHMHACFRSIKAFALYFPLVELVQSVTIAAILWYGSGQVLQDELSFGALVAFIQYVGRFFRPIRDLSDKYNILQDAMASSERIFALLDAEPEPNAGDGNGTFNSRGAIQFEDVHMSYDGTTPVLSGASFDIPAGKTTAIVGPTGAGKTTLAALVARFYDARSGRITIDGVDICSIPRARLRGSMAIVEQDVFLFSGTVRDNIALWQEDIPHEQLVSALAASRADTVLNNLPKGLDAAIGERGVNLSTGERQLLAFARALAHNPDILILDEATASVDSETERKIQDALGALLKERTAIVIAHRLSTIHDADQILVLHRGRIAERGTHAELMEKNGIYAKLYRLQLLAPE